MKYGEVIEVDDPREIGAHFSGLYVRPEDVMRRDP